MTPTRARADALVAGVGDLLVRNKAFIRRLQWMTIVLYVALLVLPLFLPLPTSRDFMWNNITRFAHRRSLRNSDDLGTRRHHFTDACVAKLND